MIKKYWIHFLMKCEYFFARLFGKKVYEDTTGPYYVWRNKLYLLEGRLVYYSQTYIFPSKEILAMKEDGTMEELK